MSVVLEQRLVAEPEKGRGYYVSHDFDRCVHQAPMQQGLLFPFLTPSPNPRGINLSSKLFLTFSGSESNLITLRSEALMSSLPQSRYVQYRLASLSRKGWQRCGIIVSIFTPWRWYHNSPDNQSRRNS